MEIEFCSEGSWLHKMFAFAEEVEILGSKLNFVVCYVLSIHTHD